MASGEIVQKEAKESVEQADFTRANDFTLPWPKADVVFVVQEQKLYFNRAVLAFHSPVFDKMFNSEFKEKDLDFEIPLLNKKFEDIQSMFKVLKMSSSYIEPISEANLNVLLQLGDEYDMPQLTLMCEKFILSNWTRHVGKYLVVVQLAFKVGSKALLPVIRAFLARLLIIQEWFAANRSYAFYSSSILLCYDAQLLLAYQDRAQVIDVVNSCNTAPMPNGDSSSDSDYLANYVNCKMIDFTHLFDLPDKLQTDENYQFGLLKLIEYLETYAAQLTNTQAYR